MASRISLFVPRFKCVVRLTQREYLNIGVDGNSDSQSQELLRIAANAVGN